MPEPILKNKGIDLSNKDIFINFKLNTSNYQIPKKELYNNIIPKKEISIRDKTYVNNSVPILIQDKKEYITSLVNKINANKNNDKPYTGKLQLKPVKKDNGTKCTEGQCSDYVQKEIYRISNSNISQEDFRKKLGLYGNAWQLSQNIKNGELIDKDYKVGDVVLINTGGYSNYQKEANKYGDGNTHTAFISKINNDGTYDIEHNIHKMNNLSNKYEGHVYTSTVKNNELNNFPFYKVAKVIRPDYNQLSSTNYIYDKEKLTNTSSNKYENNIINYANANKNKIASYLNISDSEFEDLTRATLGIINKETKFDESFTKIGIDLREPYETMSSLYKTIANTFLPKNEEYSETSQGLSRIKYDTNFDPSTLNNIKQYFNIKDIDNEYGSYIYTMKLLSDNYKYFKNKNYDNPSALYRAITKHNSPAKSRSIGKFKNENDYAKNKDVDYTNEVLKYALKYNYNNNSTPLNRLYLNKNIYNKL
jgi:hypothetical protein